MFEQLSLQGYKVCILNPKRVHNFFKAYGDIAKTDKKDAQLIAVFLEKMNPKVTSFSQENKELKELFIRKSAGCFNDSTKELLGKEYQQSSSKVN